LQSELSDEGPSQLLESEDALRETFIVILLGICFLIVIFWLKAIKKAQRIEAGEA
jgi:cbb3-type cytochrome oxidase subunit 3